MQINNLVKEFEITELFTAIFDLCWEDTFWGPLSAKIVRPSGCWSKIRETLSFQMTCDIMHGYAEAIINYITHNQQQKWIEKKCNWWDNNK